MIPFTNRSRSSVPIGRGFRDSLGVSRRRRARRVRLSVEELERRVVLSISLVVSMTGNLSLSVDGLGTLATSGTIRVQKPAGATVAAAYMAAASTGFSEYQIQNGD